MPTSCGLKTWRVLPWNPLYFQLTHQKCYHNQAYSVEIFTSNTGKKILLTVLTHYVLGNSRKYVFRKYHLPKLDATSFTASIWGWPLPRWCLSIQEDWQPPYGNSEVIHITQLICCRFPSISQYWWSVPYFLFCWSNIGFMLITVWCYAYVFALLSLNIQIIKIYEIIFLINVLAGWEGSSSPHFNP